MKNRTLSNWIISFLLMFAVTSVARSHENNLIERDEQVEVVYMFSYACPTCRLLSPYINTWERVFPEATRLPAFSDLGTGDAWRNAARRYFILHALNREKVIQLERSDIDRIGYSIQDEPAKPGVEKIEDIELFLSSWQLKVDRARLEGAWALSEMFMQDAEVMLARTRKELGRVATPVFRVSSSMGVEYIAIDSDSEDPPMDLLKRASDAVKKHKRAHIKTTKD